MELKLLIRIFRRHAHLFLAVVFLCAAIGALLGALQKPSVKAFLMLNVTRSGTESTNEYRYHDFYRLQADERFADTVVQWMRSPRLRADVCERMRARFDRQETCFFDRVSAKRLSSQMIEVSYTAPNEASAVFAGEVLVATVNAEARLLNEMQQEPAWFLVLGSDPVIEDGRVSVSVATMIALAIGVFLGFWVVLLTRYFRL
jgi:hypothetical protein